MKLVFWMVILLNGDYDLVCATDIGDAWDQVPTEHLQDVDYIERNTDNDYEDWECEID